MPSLGRGLFILSPFVLYPVVDFIFGIVNRLIAPDLQSEFDLNAAELGLISSNFFVAFGLSQLPLGLALDRYGPRAVTSLFLAMASLGALLLIWADSTPVLVLGRVLMGVGMSASLIAGIKTASIWLPGRLTLATSLLIGATGIGGMLATAPLASLLEDVGWRTPFTILVAATAMTMLATLLIVPSAPTERDNSMRQQVSSFAPVFRSMKLWRYAHTHRSRWVASEPAAPTRHSGRHSG